MSGRNEEGDRKGVQRANDRPEQRARERPGPRTDERLAGGVARSLPDGRVQIFDTWAPVPEFCDVASADLTQTYSRGNNNGTQMVEQHRRTDGETYQYETGTFDVRLSTVSLCQCVDGSCYGDVQVIAQVTIELVEGYSAAAYSLIAGPDPSEPTEPEPGGEPPAPDVELVIDEVDLPPAERANRFSPTEGEENAFLAAAARTVPCTEGEYAKRFYIVQHDHAGRSGLKPGHDIRPAAFLDVAVTVDDGEGCRLEVEMDAYLVEFLIDYDWTNGERTPDADEELPEVEYTLPDGTKKSTRSIAKLTTENDETVDEAFAEKPGKE